MRLLVVGTLLLRCGIWRASSVDAGGLKVRRSALSCGPELIPCRSSLPARYRSCSGGVPEVESRGRCPGWRFGLNVIDDREIFGKSVCEVGWTVADTLRLRQSCVLLRHNMFKPGPLPFRYRIMLAGSSLPSKPRTTLPYFHPLPRTAYCAYSVVPSERIYQALAMRCVKLFGCQASSGATKRDEVAIETTSTTPFCLSMPRQTWFCRQTYGHILTDICTSKDAIADGRSASLIGRGSPSDVTWSRTNNRVSRVVHWTRQQG